MPEIPSKDLNEFDIVEPDSSDYLICGRGRFTIGALVSLIIGQITAAPLKQNALKVNVHGTSEYGYLIFDKDADGNISPTYLTEDEYNALS